MNDALMNILAHLPPDAARTVGIWVAAVLTCAILSYILGENAAFRFAQYLFVGVAAGYAASLAWTSVLWPRLRLLWADPSTYWYYGLFFLLGVLLLSRGVKSISLLGNLPLGVLFGVGAALALGGALTGSLIPQMRASVASLSPARSGAGSGGWAGWVDALLLVIGTIAVLSAFHFTRLGQGWFNALWSRVFKVLGGLGRGLIMVTFGAILAGAAYSFLALLYSRLSFLANDWLRLGQ